ncbi:hypothetical protein [Ruegeria arenilitoris]|uniref:hypothetical protein n=1 Tax=Ruegeria arenilitoris TaxID=1173585 RepID=UPI001C95C0D5|nr:hypothetical protein [Ruegeria arenilitoris]MBY6081847.1 hypothetical protein [Ruegeria arenilitoris]
MPSPTGHIAEKKCFSLVLSSINSAGSGYERSGLLGFDNIALGAPANQLHALLNHGLFENPDLEALLAQLPGGT